MLKLPKEVAGVQLPDSEVANAAIAAVASAAPDFLLNHSLRVFVFGSLLSERNGLRFDPDLSFVASVMHDLGLTDRYATANHRFEVDGADAARRLLAEHEVTDDAADLVWDAIALHTSWGIAERRAPEVALVHYGINLDVCGIGVELLSSDEIAEVLSAHPRLEFQNRFRRLVVDHASHRPASHLFTWAGWIAMSDAQDPGAPAGQVLHSAHWTE
jgi:HD domain